MGDFKNDFHEMTDKNMWYICSHFSYFQPILLSASDWDRNKEDNAYFLNKTLKEHQQTQEISNTVNMAQLLT